MNGPSLKASELKAWLSNLQDPELQMGLVDLGLIYRIEEPLPGKVCVDMTLTSPGCPAAGSIAAQVKKRLLEFPGVFEASVALVWEPKWDPKTMASDECKDRLGIW